MAFAPTLLAPKAAVGRTPSVKFSNEALPRRAAIEFTGKLSRPYVYHVPPRASYDAPLVAPASRAPLAIVSPPLCLLCPARWSAGPSAGDVALA